MNIEETPGTNPTLGKRMEKARLEKEELPMLEQQLEELNIQIDDIKKGRELNPDITTKLNVLEQKRHDVITIIQAVKRKLGRLPKNKEEREAA